MNNLQTNIELYLSFCQLQKRLTPKTINAYKTDLKQFSLKVTPTTLQDITPTILEDFISYAHENYEPRTVKRKIASLKAFFNYLEYKELIEKNPFHKIHVKFREPIILPKTIPLYTVESFLKTLYQYRDIAKTNYQRRNALRDLAVFELLFATGMRISELCSLKKNDVNLYDGIILIHGKGAKERCMQIENSSILHILREYEQEFYDEIHNTNYFFVNQAGHVLSDQTVRRMLNKYCSMAAISLHITPHMFRHTFATSLLDAGVDIRYIQEMLGHSSINITEIYTHVAMSKKRDILATKHPRKDFNI